MKATGLNLSSISNTKRTLLRKLNQKKYREKEHQFLIEGARAVAQVLENGVVQVRGLFFDEGQRYWEQDPWQGYCSRYDHAWIDEATFAEISDTDNPQGVLALCVMPEETAPGELANQTGMLLGIDAVQDPGNLGTIIRTAAWFHTAGIISGKGTVDLFHPKVVRSTAGATGALAFCNASLPAALPVLEEKGWRVVLLDAGPGAVSLTDVEPSEKTIIVVGNEAHGISPSLVADHRIRAAIPSPQKNTPVESLNAAIATSIALYSLSGE